MKIIKNILAIGLIVCVFFSWGKTSFAVYNPFEKTNNYFGIHILFPSELENASKLVNATGGDWGYVTIPIQIGDRDIEKWQKFMDDCARLRLIPLVRLATEPNYLNTGVWRKPTDNDIVDFANFLNSLTWPTKNRYVILFNEMNRYDEWGGESPNPREYADIVNFAVDGFKARSQDFYMILGGMDNAAPDNSQYMSNFNYLAQIASYSPQTFNKIDGFASHSYPNPNFASPPSALKRMGVSTYKYEYEYINSFTSSKKPAFITETGWNGDVLSDSVIASYFLTTFSTIWNEDKDKIVAITPFLLNADGPFQKFSFYKNGAPTEYFKAIADYKKEKGSPIITPTIISPLSTQQVLGIKDFTKEKAEENINPSKEVGFTTFLKTIFGFANLY